MTRHQPLMTIAEVSQLLRIDDETARRWCREGRLSARRIGHKWLVPASSVRTLLESRPAIRR